MPENETSIEQEMRKQFEQSFEWWAKENCTSEQHKDALLSVAWFWFQLGWRGSASGIARVLIQRHHQIVQEIKPER